MGGPFSPSGPTATPSWVPIVPGDGLFVGTLSLEVGYGEGGYGEGGYDTPTQGVIPPSQPPWTTGSSE